MDAGTAAGLLESPRSSREALALCARRDDAVATASMEAAPAYAMSTVDR